MKSLVISWIILCRRKCTRHEITSDFMDLMPRTTLVCHEITLNSSHAKISTMPVRNGLKLEIHNYDENHSLCWIID